MTAQWSEIWSQKTNKFARKIALHNARFMPQEPAKSKAGGKYPHLQPFHRPGKKEKVAGTRTS